MADALFNQTVLNLSQNLGEYHAEEDLRKMKTHLMFHKKKQTQGIQTIYGQALSVKKHFKLTIQQATAVALAYNLYEL